MALYNLSTKNSVGNSITQIDAFKSKVMIDTPYGIRLPGQRLKAVIIDITYNSTADKQQELRELLRFLQEKNIWVILACSSLKNEQLGLDKYQTGKNIIIKPANAKLEENVIEWCSNISSGCMPDSVATFRANVETIYNEAELSQDKILQRYGFFPSSVGEPKKNSSCSLSSRV